MAQLRTPTGMFHVHARDIAPGLMCAGVTNKGDLLVRFVLQILRFCRSLVQKVPKLLVNAGAGRRGTANCVQHGSQLYVATRQIVPEPVTIGELPYLRWAG